MTWAIVPLKDLVSAKTRLSGILNPSERRNLAQALAEDVLECLSTCAGLSGVLLVSDDPAAELLSHRYGIDWVAEEQLGHSGLNGAVAGACELLADRGVTQALVLHGDLPLLSEDDVAAVLALARQGDADVVISPDHAGTGTNLMLMPVPLAFELHYGQGSCQAHQQAAYDSGLATECLPLDGVALDIDSPNDLLSAWRMLQHGESTSRCANLLASEDLNARMLALEAGGLGEDTARETAIGRTSNEVSSS